MGLFDKFKPKWKHKDSKIRLEAVEELDDQGILEKIAKNDSNSDVRIAAIKKIDNQSVLKYIAKNDSDMKVRDEAVKKIQMDTAFDQLVNIVNGR